MAHHQVEVGEELLLSGALEAADPAVAGPRLHAPVATLKLVLGQKLHLGWDLNLVEGQTEAGVALDLLEQGVELIS